GAAGEADALDHIRIKRALRQPVGAAQLARLLLEHVDEQPPDCLALGLRIGDALQRAEEQLGRVAVHEADVEAVAECGDDLIRLALPQQAVIDEDAGELLADRLMDQHRSDRRVDPAGEAADHPPGPYFGADAGDLGGAEAGHGPATSQPQYAVGEV